MRLPPVALVLVVAALAWAAMSHASQNLYRWVDAQGQVHFSDQAHDNAQRLNLRFPDGTASSPPPPATALNDAACKQDKVRLASYRKAASITETDALGKTHVFTPAEQQKLIARTQVAVKKNCGENAASADVSNPSGGESTQ